MVTRDDASYLTTRQLQELLQVDRLTIYRMLDAGELPAFKIGRQWRFERRAIEGWLAARNGHAALTPDPNPQPSQPPRTPEETEAVLPPPYVQPLQDVFADALEIGSVLTSAGGEPLTCFSNPWAFCERIYASPEGRAGCIASWQRLSAVDELDPQIHVCHAGLNYARAAVAVEGEIVALLFGGQFLTAERVAAFYAGLEEVATRCGLELEELQTLAQAPRVLDLNALRRLIRLLRTAGVSLSTIAQHQHAMNERLAQIVALSRQPLI